MPNEYQRKFGGKPVTRSVRGYRYWSLSSTGNLVGGHGVMWRPETQEAKCLRPKLTGAKCICDQSLFYDAFGQFCESCYQNSWLHEDHQVPDLRCQCGIYAFFRDDSPPFKDAFGQVIGVIEGFGRTTIGSRGFRCEKAKILALALRHDYAKFLIAAPIATAEPADLARQLGGIHRVPVFLRPDQLLAEFPPHTLKELGL